MTTSKIAGNRHGSAGHHARRLRKLAAGDLHELMRCWEIEHRIWTVEAHLRHIQYRKETRYPGFYYQADYPGQDDENWFCFVNSKFDPEKKAWDVFKKDYIKIIP